MVRPTDRESIGERRAMQHLPVSIPNLQRFNCIAIDRRDACRYASFAQRHDKCASSSRRIKLIPSLAFLFCLEPLREVHVDGC
jgi:hypothetical protein